MKSLISLFASRSGLDVPDVYSCWNGIGRRAIGCAFLLVASALVHARTPQAQQRMSTERNQSSQRYEINQTFDGQAFFKDNNVWAYTKEFADLFGMPAKYIEDVEGIAAAAFRIEDTSYEQCGFGGRVNACRKVDECVLDLYFDERTNPLPWATDIKSQWQPAYASMRWLRPLNSAERPHGTLAVEPAPGIIRNETLHGQMIPFADPVSKREAIFTTNINVSENSGWSMSGAMAIIGYTRDFYRSLSVVNLQFGCATFSRKAVDIRLDAKRQVFDSPIAKFNQVRLPEGLVQRIKDLQKAQSEKNASFYRGLFEPPLGTRGASSTTSPASR
jgi:hypothetical protein